MRSPRGELPNVWKSSKQQPALSLMLSRSFMWGGKRVTELGDSASIYTPDPAFTRHLKMVRERVNTCVQTGKVAYLQRQIGADLSRRDWTVMDHSLLLPCLLCSTDFRDVVFLTGTVSQFKKTRSTGRIASEFIPSCFVSFYYFEWTLVFPVIGETFQNI